MLKAFLPFGGAFGSGAASIGFGIVSGMVEEPASWRLAAATPGESAVGTDADAPLPPRATANTTVDIAAPRAVRRARAPRDDERPKVSLRSELFMRISLTSR